MSNKLPAFQLYPGDWRKDPAVQALDFEYRGVWFEMLLIMHESEQRGKLLLNGNPMPEKALARLLGLDLQKLQKIISTLLEYGVASIDEDTGAIINRRMVRDEEIRQKRREAGKKGGNPNLVKQKSTKTKKEVNQSPKQNTTPSSSFSPSTSSSNKDKYTGGFEEFWELYDVKKGKKKAWLEWKKLTEAEKAKIMENVPIFLTHFSSEHYTPRPRKYLYNRYWEDEGYQKPQTQPEENELRRRNSRGFVRNKGDEQVEQLRDTPFEEDLSYYQGRSS